MSDSFCCFVFGAHDVENGDILCQGWSCAEAYGKERTLMMVFSSCIDLDFIDMVDDFDPRLEEPYERHVCPEHLGTPTVVRSLSRRSTTRYGRWRIGRRIMQDAEMTGEIDNARGFKLP